MARQRMNSLRPSPRAAATALEQLQGCCFEVTVSSKERHHPALGAWVQETVALQDEERALELVRQRTGFQDVEIWVEGTPRPLGEYPFSRLTVMVDRQGSAILAFFGD